jgi:uncharacterized membrane protein YfcA
MHAMMAFFSVIKPLYVMSGFIVGLLVGQTGVGGGSLMTPLLVLLFGIHPATAVGTDLLYAAATKTAGTLIHGIHGTVDWRLTGRLAAGSIPAAVLTLVILAAVNPQHRATAHFISEMLGVVLILTAIALLLRNWIFAAGITRFADLDERRRALLTVVTGAVLGVLVSITSVGAGAIGVVALVMLYPRRRIATIVGSDIAHAVPLTLVGGIGYWIVGSVDWLLLLSLLCGSIPGIAIGSMLSARIPDAVLRPILAAMLLTAGALLF